MRTRSKGVKIPKKFDNATLTAPGPVAQQIEQPPPKRQAASASLAGVTQTLSPRGRRIKAQTALIRSLVDGGLPRWRALEYSRIVDALASEIASTRARAVRVIAGCAATEMGLR